MPGPLSTTSKRSVRGAAAASHGSTYGAVPARATDGDVRGFLEVAHARGWIA